MARAWISYFMLREFIATRLNPKVFLLDPAKHRLSFPSITRHQSS